jgi:hypothetical protein
LDLVGLDYGSGPNFVMRSALVVLAAALRPDTLVSVVVALRDEVSGLLRHAAVSRWLNSGLPTTEVARRAGHGVSVLLKIYAHCIDGHADAANNRITDALGVQDTRPESEPADEGDDGSEQAS